MHTETPTAPAEHPDFVGPSETEVYRWLPLTALVESGHNPRRQFSEAKLDELTQSIREHGIVEPLVVRPLAGLRPSRYEIVAGARRYRAAQRASLERVPALVRRYSDEDVLELVLIENLQRDDLAPLEQAAGFKALIDSNPEKHTAAAIATKIGMSEAWVWDRLKLNDLIPEAKQLLAREKMAVGHAILLARQKPEHQRRIIDPQNGGLFTRLIHGLEFDGDRDPKEKPGPYDDVKPVSVRELEAWIAGHIRFDVEHMAQAVPLQFEQVAERVREAAAQPGRGKKVIAITFDHLPAEDAKDPSERTYGVRSWRRADGTEKTQRTDGYPSRLVDSPVCEHSVLGVVAAGLEHYGKTFQVCIARDKCRVHWGKEIKERAKLQKLRASGKTTQANKRESAAREKQQRAELEEKRKRAEWETVKKAFLAAAKQAVGELEDVTPGLFALLLTRHSLPASTKPADLALALVRDAVQDVFHDYAGMWQRPAMEGWLTALGVDVKALVKGGLAAARASAAAAAPKTGQAPARKKQARAVKKKGGAR